MRKIFVITLLIFCSFRLSAQIRGETKTYTLQECNNIALQNNPNIQIAQAQILPAKADVTNAFGEFLPSIDIRAGYTRQLTQKSVSSSTQYFNFNGTLIPFTPGQSTVNPNSYQANVTANWIIFNGFSRENDYNRSQDYLNSQYLNFQFTQKNILANVYSQYVDIIKNRQIVKTRQENIDLQKQVLDRIKAQFEAGLLPEANVFAQEAAVGNSQMDLITSQNALNLSKSTLLTTMGLIPDISVDFAESSIPNQVTDTDVNNFRNDIGNVNSAYNEALGKRIDYSSQKAAIEAAKSSIKIAEATYYPTLSAQGGWNWTNSELSNFSENGRTYVGLSLSVPIFQNFTQYKQTAQAQFQLNQLQFQQTQLEQTIRNSVQSAFLNLDAAEQQIKISDQTVLSAQKNYESWNERFRVGSANITDYQTANNQLITSQINRINAIYNYYQAKQQLLYAIGRL